MTALIKRWPRASPSDGVPPWHKNTTKTPNKLLAPVWDLLYVCTLAARFV